MITFGQVKKGLRAAPTLEKIPTWICVVALALHDDRGRWLMHRRPLHKHHGGLWEFPGGKVEPDSQMLQTAELCSVRAGESQVVGHMRIGVIIHRAQLRRTNAPMGARTKEAATQRVTGVTVAPGPVG